MNLKTSLGLAFSLLTVAVSASPALAAQRHAAPSGSGTDCTLASPCSLSTAFDGASSGDELILASGDYGSPSAPPDVSYGDNWKALDVHGVPGQPLPRIWSSAATDAVQLVSPDSRLAYVDIEMASPDHSSLYGNLASIDHVRLDGGTGLVLSNGTGPSVTISNTVIHGTADGATGIWINNIRGPENATVDLHVRNVSVLEEGTGSPALTVISLGVSGGHETTNALISNSILRGGPSSTDVIAQAEGAGDAATITLDHSNFGSSAFYGNGTKSATPVTENGNQSAAPLLAGPDLRQATGSPTIDAGVADPLAGATDLFGGARVSGSAIDIGAHELAQPAPVVDDHAGDGSVADAGNGSGGDGGAVAGGAEPGGSGQGAGSGGPGPKPAGCVVPRVAGKTLAAAKAALRRAGCTVGKVTRTRSPRRAGKVLTQRTKPGTRAKGGTKVALVVGRR